MDDVFAEFAIVLENIIHHCAEKNDVAACAERDPDVGHGRSPRETRVDVDNLCTLLARFHNPLKTHGVILGH